MTIANAINHWPVFKGLRLCGEKQGTANPRQTITCKCCREKLEAKVSAHRAAAAAARSDKEKRFFAADADHWQRILDVVA